MSTAKQMTPMNYDNGTSKKTPEYDQVTVTGPQGRDCKPAKGEAPKSAMIDGPFGGKKPA